MINLITLPFNVNFYIASGFIEAILKLILLTTCFFLLVWSISYFSLTFWFIFFNHLHWKLFAKTEEIFESVPKALFFEYLSFWEFGEKGRVSSTFSFIDEEHHSVRSWSWNRARIRSIVLCVWSDESESADYIVGLPFCIDTNSPPRALVLFHRTPILEPCHASTFGTIESVHSRAMEGHHGAHFDHLLTGPRDLGRDIGRVRHFGLRGWKTIPQWEIFTLPSSKAYKSLCNTNN